MQPHSAEPVFSRNRGHADTHNPFRQLEKEILMESFTVTVKVSPANKAIPSVSTTHVCYATTCVQLFTKFLMLMGEFEGPPGTETTHPAESRRLDKTPPKVD